jgi:hypothetical protein
MEILIFIFISSLVGATVLFEWIDYIISGSKGSFIDYLKFKYK